MQTSTRASAIRRSRQRSSSLPVRWARGSSAAHRRPSDLVEHAVDEDHAIVTVGKVEAARLNALSLVLGAALGVSRVPSVVAGVVEAGDGLLARLAEKLGLVEALADRGRGARDERKVGETDLPLAQSVRALVQVFQLLAGADSSTCCAATHVAVGLEPGNRAVEALPVVLVGIGKLCGQTGELQLVLIDLLAATNQLGGDRLAGSRHDFPDLTLHTESV